MSLIFVLIFVLVIDVFFITKEIKNKVIYKGRRKFKAVIPLIIVAFASITFKNNNFRIEDIITCIAILPLAFVGNKTGITEKGFLFNSYVTPWDKVESYSLDDKGDKYIVSYKTNVGSRRIVFKQEDKNDVKKYLLGINKLRYSRK